MAFPRVRPATEQILNAVTLDEVMQKLPESIAWIDNALICMKDEAHDTARQCLSEAVTSIGIVRLEFKLDGKDNNVSRTDGSS